MRNKVVSHFEYFNIDRTQESLFHKYGFLLSQGFKWYEDQVKKLFVLKSIPRRENPDLVNQMLARTINESLKKKKNKEYYLANAIVFLDVLKNIVTTDSETRFSSKNQVNELIIFNYFNLIRKLLLDSLILLDDYRQFVLNKNRKYEIYPSDIQHTVTIYQSLRQAIFGQLSFDSFKDLEPNLSISIIRQLIELRFRRAFGVLGCFSLETHSIEPISMNKIFKVIKEFEKTIDFSFPFDTLSRIYNWANFFLHTGIKEYIWKPIFIKNVLREFFLGKGGGTCVYNGIVIPKEVIKKVWLELEKLTTLKIIKIPIEAKLI